MASQRRFMVFSDENQVPQKVSNANAASKRAPLALLSAPNRGRKLAATLKPLAAASDKENQATQETTNENCEANELPAAVVEKDNEAAKPKSVAGDEKPKRSENEKDGAPTQRVPLKVLDEVMFSPASVGSPMVVSPMPESVQQEDREELTINEEMFDDEFFTEQYGDSHFAYMKELEVKLRARPEYMSRQRDISSTMRSVLVDWLVEVNEEYGMSDETLFLAVSFIDRFLSVMSVVRSKLQLVGTAAMLVASKVEEIYPPELAQYVYVTDDTYTGSQIIRMEALLLNTLGFSLGAAHSLAFVRRLSVRAKVSRRVAHLAQYICELSLMTDSSLMYKPSEIAAGALLIALDQTNNSSHMWTDEVERFADIDKLTLKTVVNFLHKLLVAAPNSQHKATTEKYCHVRYSSVAMFPTKTDPPRLI
ncbi:cyclin-A2 [Galendromus occidentalis]|uniref:Cyclin-A2 n=1 Tax=Galendromus occidentalis TaxID=34638 RepID=A0AAJ6QM38_9ACAR|nr:cyclin-A2 [Galendromus occidentalis]